METKIRVLIADPNEEFSALLADTLESEGDIAVVGIAADGMQAISMLTEAKPDVLLLDLVMPKLDGMQLVEELSKELPIILMTAYGNVEYAVLAMEKGAFNFIKRHYTVVNIVCGSLLILIGILMATGVLNDFLQSLA